MAKLKVHKEKGYTNIQNSTLQDKALSFKARGLLGYMLSLPDDWDFSIKGIQALNPTDGYDSIRTGLKELEDNKYLYREQIRANGVITDWEYHFFHSSELYDTFALKLGNQIKDNPEQLKLSSTSKDIPDSKRIEETIKEIDTESVYPHLSKILNSSIIPLLKQYLSNDTLNYLEKNEIEKWKIDILMYKLENKVEPVRNQLAYVKTILQSMTNERV